MFDSKISEQLFLSFLIIAVLFEVLVFLSFFESFIYLKLFAIFDSKKAYFHMILLVLLVAIIYVLLMRRNLEDQKRNLNCSNKISLGEFEKMKKENTAYHLEKLRNSQEFKDYWKKKLEGNFQAHKGFVEDENDKIVFSDEE